MSIYNILAGSSRKPFSMAYVGLVGAYTAGNSSSETYTGVNIGTADPTRILVVSMAGANFGGTAAGTTSVTVDGTPMNAQVNLTTSRSPTSIWTLPYPTGATATFVVNHYSATTAVWLYVMYNTINNGTATNTASAYTASSLPSMILTMPAGGGAVYAIANCGNPPSTNYGTNVGQTLAFGFQAGSCLVTPTTAGSLTNNVTSATSGFASYACASFI